MNPLHRLVVPIAALTVGAALAVVPSAAHADSVTGGDLMVMTSVANESGSAATCSDGTDSTQHTPFTANGSTVTETSTSSTSITDSAATTDVTTASAAGSGKVRVQTSDGALKQLDFSGTGTLSVDPALGTASKCVVQAEAVTSGELKITLMRATRVGLSGQVDAQGQLLVVIAKGAPLADTAEHLFLLEHGHSTSTQSFVLQPGTYNVLTEGGAELQTPTAAGDPTSLTAGGAARVTFSAPGSAKSASSGTAGSLVDLPADRDCGNPTHLTTTFKPAAGTGKGKTVKKAVFRVNGKVVKTVLKPSAGLILSLPGLVETADATVSVSLTMAKGGPKSLSRSYYQCA